MSDREFRILRSNACTRVGRPQKKVNFVSPLSYPEWFLAGVRHYESKGANFLLNGDTVQIYWPQAKEIVFRTKQDFADEYYREYLPKFGICTLPGVIA